MPQIQLPFFPHGDTNTLERMAASVGPLSAVEPSFVASVECTKCRGTL